MREDDILGVFRVHSDHVVDELLDLHLVQRQRCDSGVWVLLLVSKVGDEKGDVLLKLCEVKSHVGLVELQIVIVLHWLGNGKEEVGLSEVLNHVLSALLDLNHLVFDGLDLLFLVFGLFLVLHDCLLKLLSDFLLLLLTHVLDLLVCLDIIFDVSILLFDGVDVRVEGVNVVV